MSPIRTKYDVAVVGGGHNGLVAACYLAKAGMSVLVLERESVIGGASRSSQIFEGVDAKLSVYAYLVSLFPDKIISDLGLGLNLRSRKTASWTPSSDAGTPRDLLLHNGDANQNRDAFIEFNGDDRDYRGYLELQQMQQALTQVVWPSLTKPLVARETMRDSLDRDARLAWQAIIEEPLGGVIERCISDDLTRGLVFTDGKIGVSTHPHDPSLIQNRCFLYHIIGRGTGEWHVPVGGMGTVVSELTRVAKATGKVTFKTDAQVTHIAPGEKESSIAFETGDGAAEVDARFVLCNASAEVLARLVGSAPAPDTTAIQGAGTKLNMLLKRLPKLKTGHCTSAEAFSGTVHIDEGYAQMDASYRDSIAGQMPAKPPFEIYCHTLTDDSILSADLAGRGYHTLTLFGLDMPHALFESDNETLREEMKTRYLAGINQHLAEPIEDCLATDANGAPCLEAMTPVDLENKVHLPKGNIFHGDLSWPFTDAAEQVGEWGVETAHRNILLCGSAAMRGGAVSGIPGHNAAMKVLELTS